VRHKSYALQQKFESGSVESLSLLVLKLFLKPFVLLKKTYNRGRIHEGLLPYFNIYTSRGHTPLTLSTVAETIQAEKEQTDHLNRLLSSQLPLRSVQLLGLLLAAK
jgi:hypothetical protein